MDVEIKDKASQRHVGRNLQRIRVYLGMKQEALAADLGISQQEISKIEKQDEIEDKLLTQIANSYKDATISPGATATVYAHTQQINPLDKIVELYERLLQSEREKIELLKNANK